MYYFLKMLLFFAIFCLVFGFSQANFCPVGEISAVCCTNDNTSVTTSCQPAPLGGSAFNTEAGVFSSIQAKRDLAAPDWNTYPFVDGSE